MTLRAGLNFGPYQVTDLLGAGGMGEVYRARDTKLDRDVAIKTLPKAFASDVDRLARLQREAKMLAALNHPHIAQIYGFAEDKGIHAIVMELVEGPTLADRIAKGPIPLDEALALARQIAEALEAAHAQGVVHRDLKPANIKVRPDDTVKVLDFGLAKAIEPTSPASDANQSPTLSVHATQAGLVLGTAAYMAPEQARGRPVDSRADIWAFGVVLFEMLGGRRPFDGEEISDIVAGILLSEPAWEALPRDTPPAIRRLLRRCLQKDRHQRWQHIGDARLEIEDAQRGAAAESIVEATGLSRRHLPMAASVIAALAVGVVGGWRTADPPDAAEMRLEIATPAAATPQFAISSDGRLLAFANTSQGARQLWVRPLAETTARPLAGTEGAEYPFWAPDSRSLGFFAYNKLKRVDIDGGQPDILATVITPAGGTWNADGTILFVPGDSGGIFRVSATGGEVVEVTPRRTPPLATRLPQFLPDGQRFLFYVARGGEPPGVYVGDVRNDTLRRVMSADAPAEYGLEHLWFVRGTTLFAQRFDPSTLELSGPIVRVAEEVGFSLIAANFRVSVNGPIAYRTGPGQAPRELVWYDRSGKRLAITGEPGSLISNPSLSPDGRYLVAQRTVQENIDLWLLDLQRNVFTRLTVQPGIDAMPVWSPDGRRVLFNRAATANPLTIMHLDRTTADEELRPESGRSVKIACDWSLDGRYILYKQFDDVTGTTDLWALPMEGDRTPRPVVNTPSDERDGQFSPDGRWVAYESNESGQPEIYVQPFPGPGSKLRVSTAGGTQVRWRRDGKELFYIAADDRLMAVSLDLGSGRPGVGAAVPLFRTHIAPVRTISRQQYVVAADGERFLISTTEPLAAPPITLILNWKAPAARSE